MAISFAKLDAIADLLAGRLAVLGAAPGIRVHIAVRDADLKVAFWLAVWRLGADLVAGDALEIYAKFNLEPHILITDRDDAPPDAVKFDAAWLDEGLSFERLDTPGKMYFTTNATKRAAHIVGIDAAHFWQDILYYQRLLGPAKGMFFFYSSLDSFRTFRDVVRAFLEGQAVIGPHPDEQVCLNSICTNDVAEVFLAPLTLRRLVDALHSKPRTHNIQRIFVASGSAQATLLKQAHDIIGAEIGLAAGAMECSIFTYMVYDPATYSQGQIGKVQNGIEARIVDERGLPVPPDRMGLLKIRVPEADRFEAYANADPAWDAEGWIDMRFVASMDKTGCITKHGRTDDRLNFGGLRLFSAHIEQIITKIDQVEKVAAIRVFTENGAEALGLAVELNAPLSPRSIAETAKKGLPNIEEVQVALVEKLPVKADGSPDRAMIADRWAKLL